MLTLAVIFSERMMTRPLFIFLSMSLACHVSNGQINILDSCGVNSKLELNKYEIRIVDSLFLAPNKTKKGVTIDPKEGFDLTNKKISFFSCSKDSQTKGNGLLSKSEFFEIARQNFEGYAGKGIIAFDENQKRNQTVLTPYW